MQLKRIHIIESEREPRAFQTNIYMHRIVKFRNCGEKKNQQHKSKNDLWTSSRDYCKLFAGENGDEAEEKKKRKRNGCLRKLIKMHYDSII